MHKTFSAIIFSIFTLLSFCSWAQNDTTYYTEDGVKTEWAYSQYYEVVYPKVDGRYKVEQHFNLRNKLKMTGYCVRLDSSSMDGPYITYDTKGHKTMEGNYEYNKMIGVWKQYYENSDSLWYIINYGNGELKGELTSYYKDGKVKRKETYLTNNAAIGSCYAEDGKEIAFTPFSTMPEPSVALDQFLSKNLHYPQGALESNIQGRVMMRFIVTEDGTITHMTVLKKVGYGFDEEAMRVLSIMPKWKPGMEDDIPVKTWFTLPLTFRLQ